MIYKSGKSSRYPETKTRYLSDLKPENRVGVFHVGISVVLKVTRSTLPRGYREGGAPGGETGALVYDKRINVCGV